MKAGWLRWLQDRFGLDAVREHVLVRRVPKTPWYYGDGAAVALLFGVQIATGVALALVYSASPETARDSVQHLTTVTPLGWLLRALHYWSGGLMVVLVTVHLLRQVLVGGYKAPREGTWLVGVALFWLVLVLSFTGYVLRWDERGLTALRVALTMFDQLPWVGTSLVLIIQGGAEPGAHALSRLYAAHTLIVPGLLAALVGFHLYLVIRHGITAPAEGRHEIETAAEQRALYERIEASPKHSEQFHPSTTASSGVAGLIAFGLAFALALVLGPAPLGPPADTLAATMPREEWWFMWYSALIALTPPAIAPWLVVVLPVTVFAVMIALPLVDRGPSRGIRQRPWAIVLVVAVVLGLAGLTSLRVRSAWTGWPDPTPPALPAGVVLPPDAEAGRQLFARYGCNGCHAVAGAGPQVGPDFARLQPPRTRAAMSAFIMVPAVGAGMPAYAGRLSAEELRQLVSFVDVAQTFPLAR